jgi:hypothetical protein
MTGRAKQTLLVHLRAFVVRDFGDTGWERLVASLPAEDRALLDGLLLSGGWIPVGIWNRAVDTFLAANYADARVAMGYLATFIADRDLNSVFRLVLKVGSPDFVIGRSGSIYNRYFEPGTVVPQKIGPKHWMNTLTAPRGEDEGPGLHTCETGVGAWLAHALRLSGVQATVKHVKCRFHHAPHCEYDLTW